MKLTCTAFDYHSLFLPLYRCGILVTKLCSYYFVQAKELLNILHLLYLGLNTKGVMLLAVTAEGYPAEKKRFL